MRKILILIQFCLLLSITVLSQNLGIKTIPAEYTTSNITPLMFFAGDTLLINCDTILVMNKGRYQFYKNIHFAIQQDNDSLCRNLLKAYEIRLVDHENSYTKLLKNSHTAEKTAMELVTFTQNSLANTQITLTNTQNTLDKTLKNLQLANEHLKKERWNAAGKKVLIGVGGVAVGIITGVLIAK